MSKILFATMPFDGHFNPLTALAVHLRERGHDVRWYTGATYAAKLAAIGVPHFPYQRAREVNAENLAQLFPEYETLGTGPKAIEFALRQLFFGNLEAHYRDVLDLRAAFTFDALVFDAAFYAARLIAETCACPAYAIWPAPTPAPTSKQAPPPFFGLRPARSILGRIRDRVVRALVERSTRSGMRMLDELRRREGLAPYVGSVFDLHIASSRRIFQIGVPALDFPRTDWPANLEFIGALLPYRKPAASAPLPFADKLERYGKAVVVSQGTVDNRDPDKLFVPTLEALAGTNRLVIATTGGRHTEALRRRYPQDNVVIEDWIDFHTLFEHVALFVCNGGFGSVLLALSKGVPVLAAGKLEGKNDVNARLEFAGVGLDLRTERPSPAQIAAGVDRMLGDRRYVDNVDRIRRELERYRPLEIVERALEADGLGTAGTRGAWRSSSSIPRATTSCPRVRSPPGS